MASSLRDGDKWEQVGVKVVTAGATGAAVGLGLAVLLFGGVRSRSACMSVCTGAGLGHGLILGKGTFEDAREHLPAQLSQGPPPTPGAHTLHSVLFACRPQRRPARDASGPGAL